MITVRRNKRKDAGQFAVFIELNDGEHFFTERAARELRNKLSSVLAELKKEAKEIAKSFGAIYTTSGMKTRRSYVPPSPAQRGQPNARLERPIIPVLEPTSNRAWKRL